MREIRTEQSHEYQVSASVLPDAKLFSSEDECPRLSDWCQLWYLIIWANWDTSHRDGGGQVRESFPRQRHGQWEIIKVQCRLTVKENSQANCWSDIGGVRMEEEHEGGESIFEQVQRNTLEGNSRDAVDTLNGSGRAILHFCTRRLSHEVRRHWIDIYCVSRVYSE